MTDNPPKRFQCIEEPFSCWMIWDTEELYPAELAGILLIGLSSDEAQAICFALNAQRLPSESVTASAAAR